MPSKDKGKGRRTQSRIRQKELRRKVQEMRPFMRKLKDLDLRKKLSPSQIGYINRAFTEYQELTTRPVKIFRSPNKKHLEKAQAYARHAKGAPKFDVAFVPVADPSAKIQFKGNRMRVVSRYVTEEVIFFDLLAMAENPHAEIARAIAENPDAQQFVIIAGKYLFNGGIKRSILADEVMNLMMQYNDPDDNHFWGNWLFGLVSAEYQNQKEFDLYRREYKGKLDEIKRQKAAMRRAWAQKFGHKPNA